MAKQPQTFFPPAPPAEHGELDTFDLKTVDGDGHNTTVSVINVVGPAGEGPITVTEKHARINLLPTGWTVHDPTADSEPTGEPGTNPRRTR